MTTQTLTRPKLQPRAAPGGISTVRGVTTAPPPRRFVQMFLTPDGAQGALACDGTTWWWHQKRGWQPLYDEAPQ